MNDQGFPLPATEAEITKILLSHVQDLGVLAWMCEARSHGRARADVVLLWNAQIVAVEVKRTDWKGAVLQAVLNRYCADRSFIALWETQVSGAVVAEAARHGLGVLSVTPDSLQVVEDALPASPDPTIRTRLLGQFTSGRA